MSGANRKRVLVLSVLLLCSTTDGGFWKVPPMTLEQSNATVRQMRFEHNCKVVTCHRTHWKQGTKGPCAPATGYLSNALPMEENLGNRTDGWWRWTWRDSIGKPGVLSNYFGMLSSMSCHADCGIRGLLPLFYHQLAWLTAWMYHFEHPLWRGWPATIYSFGYITSFISPVIYIPLNIVFNLLNLIVLKKLLTKDSGAAIYFHKGEVISDMLSGVFTNLDVSTLPSAMIVRWTDCKISHYVNFVGIGAALRQISVTINQCFILALVADRLYGVVRPFKYRKADQRVKSRVWARRIVALSILLWAPLGIVAHSGLLYGFDSARQLSLVELNSSWNALVIAALVVAQIIVAIVYMNKFKSFAARKHTNKARLAALDRERRMKHMLVGTLGVNLLTALFGTIKHMCIAYRSAYSIAWGKTANELNSAAFQKQSPHYLYFFLYPECLLILTNNVFNPFFRFINSCSGMFFHIAFSKAYRRAFWRAMPLKKKAPVSN